MKTVKRVFATTVVAIATASAAWAMEATEETSFGIVSGQVTVVVYKPDGSSETVYDQNTSEGSLPGSVSTTSTASGSGTVYVYLNGGQVSSYSVDFE